MIITTKCYEIIHYRTSLLLRVIMFSLSLFVVVAVSVVMCYSQFVSLDYR